MYTSSQHVPERNQDATIYVGTLTANVSEELLWELFLQSGPVVNVHIPKDKVTNVHQVMKLLSTVHYDTRFFIII